MSRRRKKKAMNTASSTPSPAPKVKTEPTYEERLELQRKLFDKIKDFKDLYDASDLPRVTSYTFSKITLRQYMQAPYSNAKNLRNLSRFLYTRSQVYNRIINNMATMINPKYRSVIPSVSLTKDNDPTKLIKSYEDTLNILDRMNLSSELLKATKKCWIEDVFYGVYYYYKDQGGVVLPMDPDYCQIIGMYASGDFRYAMDMSYFQSNQDELELWGEPFDSMYRQYQSNTQNNRWLPIPDEYCMCFKINLEDYLTPLPPFLPIFDSIINLEDLKEITAVADEQQIYKLLSFEMPLLDSTKRVNDFAVDPDLCLLYFEKVKEALPDFTDAVISPMPVEAITFNTDQAADVDKIENSNKNILKTSGQTMLAEQEGSTAILAALKSDSKYAISALLPQIQAWVNRFLGYQLTNPSKVKFLEVTEYTKDTYKEALIKDMNYGLPVITTLGVLNGYSESDLIGMATINNALNLNELFAPLATSSTRSSDDEGGRPVDETPSSEADESRDKADRAG